MLTSAWMAGADVAPAPAPGAPAVVSTGSACAPACCDDGCGRVGLWSRLKGRGKRDCCDAPPPCPPPPPCKPVCKPVCKPCPPPPVCKPVCKPCPPPPVCKPVCKPAPVCAPACDDGCGRVGLWSRLKGRFHRNDCCDAPCGPAGPGHPEVIPAPKTPDKGKGGITGIQIEPIVTPVVAPRPPIEIGGPVNPF